jgi:sugar phosphate isomerase/epimerase
VPSHDYELIASYWTLAGDVDPRTDDTASRWDFAARVAAAREAGFAGFGIRYTDLLAVRSRLGLPAMRTILSDAGVRHVELEVLIDWFADGERRLQSDRMRADMLEAAKVLGARHIKITGDRSGQPWPTRTYVDAFASLCAEAEPAGALVVLEPIPMTGVATLAAALEIVTAAGASNGGVVIDIWHMERAHTALEEIAAAPRELVGFVELNDAPATDEPPTWDETFMSRTLCGEGDFDIPGFVSAIRRIGYSGPIGVEIIGAEHRKRDLQTAARVSFDSTRRFLA